MNVINISPVIDLRNRYVNMGNNVRSDGGRPKRWKSNRA